MTINKFVKWDYKNIHSVGSLIIWPNDGEIQLFTRMHPERSQAPGGRLQLFLACYQTWKSPFPRELNAPGTRDWLIFP